MDNAPRPSLLHRHQFLILRLHSLSGLLPVGAYMVVHLITNASVLAGAPMFQKNVDSIHSLPMLPLIEWTFIFLPIIFHAVVGVIIIRSGLSNTSSYALMGNFRYMLQRATAWIALFFIFYHVLQMHGIIHSEWWLNTIQSFGAQFNHNLATSSAARALASVPVKVIYLIGMLSCVYHFANGLWTQGITWGLWTTPAAQRRANYLCAAIGIFVAAIGVAALVGLSTTDMATALASERVSLESQIAELEKVKAEGGTGLDRQIDQLQHELDLVTERQQELTRPAAAKTSQNEPRLQTTAANR